MKVFEFRPINILRPIEKIVEIAVYNQIVDHVVSNHMLSKHQCGFRKKHLCETAVQLCFFK